MHRSVCLCLEGTVALLFIIIFVSIIMQKNLVGVEQQAPDEDADVATAQTSMHSRVLQQ